MSIKTIKIPDFLNVKQITVKNGVAVIEYNYPEAESEPIFEPKDGDFITANNGIDKSILIVKSYSKECIYYYALYCENGCLLINHSGLKQTNDSLIFSTDDEKQQLLDELDKAGYLWNADKKRIEKKRWRAGKDGEYWMIGLSKIELMHEYDKLDDILFDRYNYFQTEEQATDADNLVTELLFHLHKQDEIFNQIKELLK